MTKEVKFKRQYQKDYKGVLYDNDSGKSKTQPSMSLTVRDLMERHTRGLETNEKVRDGIFLEEGQEVPNIQDMNDIQEMKEALQEKYNEINKKVKDEKLEIQKKHKQREEETKATYTTTATEPVQHVPKVRVAEQEP